MRQPLLTGQRHRVAEGYLYQTQNDQSQNDHSQIRPYLEWTIPRMDHFQNGLFLERTKPGIELTQNGPYLEHTQDDHSQNLETFTAGYYSFNNLIQNQGQECVITYEVRMVQYRKSTRVQGQQIRQTYYIWPPSFPQIHSVRISVSLVMEDPDEPIVCVPAKNLGLVVLGKRILRLVASRIGRFQDWSFQVREFQDWWRLGFDSSRNGRVQDWSVLGLVVLGMVVLGMVVLGLVQVPAEEFELFPRYAPRQFLFKVG